jgi:hypothetical protein
LRSGSRGAASPHARARPTGRVSPK